MAGAMAEKFVDRWRDVYFAARPDAAYPHDNGFLRNFDVNYIEVREHTVRPMGPVVVQALQDPLAYLPIWVGRQYALLAVDRHGQAVIDVRSTFYQIKETVSEVLDMEDAQAELVDRWIAKWRTIAECKWRRANGIETAEEKAERQAVYRKLKADRPDPTWSVEPDGSIIDADGVVLVEAPGRETPLSELISDEDRERQAIQRESLVTLGDLKRQEDERRREAEADRESRARRRERALRRPTRRVAAGEIPF